MPEQGRDSKPIPKPEFKNKPDSWTPNPFDLKPNRSSVYPTNPHWPLRNKSPNETNNFSCYGNSEQARKDREKIFGTDKRTQQAKHDSLKLGNLIRKRREEDLRMDMAVSATTERAERERRRLELLGTGSDRDRRYREKLESSAAEAEIRGIEGRSKNPKRTKPDWK